MRAKDKISYRSGSHVVLECYKCSREKLEDGTLILNLLKDLPKQLEIGTLRPPYVFDNNGLSGVVLIEEGHMVIHTFPSKGKAFVDVFSYNAFDSTLLVGQILKAFEAGDHKLELTCQGAEFPHQIKLAGNLKLEEKDRVLTHL
ncbi:MAG: S-adenosylmethionine decarboxylase [Candidatus Margulisiibacteriota bacterium]|nr:S-adenosylmethionine decarboxylase [Candidatus Margulisiibacteriota bacterium]